MTLQTHSQPVRLRTPADIVEATPHLVGFQPTDSLVVIALRGKSRRLGVVARLDLAELWHNPNAAKHVRGFLERDRASSVILVFYPPSDGREHPAIAVSLDRLREAFAAAAPAQRLEIVDALCVFDGRWWSMLCEDPGCCPAQGTPVERDGVSPVAAASVASGRVTLASRDELARTIEPVTGLAAAAMEHALRRVNSSLAPRLDDDGAESAIESVRLLRANVEARAGARGASSEIGVDDAARLIAGLADVRVRDTVLSWLIGERAEETRSLLHDLARRALPPFDVAPLTLLAWASYLHGEGALAGIAIDRLLRAGQRGGLIDVLDQALNAGLNPAVFRSALADPRVAPGLTPGDARWRR